MSRQPLALNDGRDFAYSRIMATWNPPASRLVFLLLALLVLPAAEGQAQETQKQQKPPAPKPIRENLENARVRNQTITSQRDRAQNRRRGSSPPTGELRQPPSSPETLALWRDFYSSSSIAGKRHARVVQDAYRDILRRWATERSMDQVKLLAELEFRLRNEPDCVEVEQRNLHRELKEKSPGSLLPLVGLRILGWQEALQTGRLDRLESDGRRAEKLAREHADSFDADPRRATARRQAASMLTLLAERTWTSGYARLFDSALLNLKTALDLAPDHVPARHFRAVIYERLGLYRKATRDLQSLHEAHPERADVALRLAVQLGRLSRYGEADRLLDELIEKQREVDEWIHAVAYQERTHQLIDRDRHPEALARLAEARELHPVNERLLLMTVDLERRRHGRADPRSRALLDQWRQDHGVSPRLRYLQGPLKDLEGNRDRLMTDLDGGFSALASGLLELGARSSGRGVLACRGTWRRLQPKGEPKRPPRSPDTVAVAPRHPTPHDSRTAQGDAEPTSPLIRPAEEQVATRATERFDNLPGTVYVDPVTGASYRVDEVVDLELQQIYVSPPNDRALRLEASEVKVLDNGQEQNIVTFESGDIPFTATLLIDASASMRGPRMLRALAGARVFLDAMDRHDRTRLLLAADRVRGVSSFLDAGDPSVEELARRLDPSQVAGGTALFDHLFLAVDALEPEQGRKVVIVLSDGFDTLSAVPMDSVREAVRRSQIQLYWVRILEGPGVRRDAVPLTGWRSRSESSRSLSLLERTVETSGGRIVEVNGAHQVAGALSQILDDLRRQIAIGYYPSDSKGDGEWHEVEVKSTRSGTRLRHAAGYFDG